MFRRLLLILLFAISVPAFACETVRCETSCIGRFCETVCRCS